MSVYAAKECYLKRQLGEEEPCGSFDSKGRWFPSEEEVCPCCVDASPSTKDKHRALHHCRSIQHVAQLFKVDETELRQVLHRRAGYIPFRKELEEAAELYILRQTEDYQKKLTHRLPGDAGCLSCCKKYKQFSKGMKQHCCTLEHIAHLYRVDLEALKKEVRTVGGINEVLQNIKLIADIFGFAKV